MFGDLFSPDICVLHRVLSIDVLYSRIDRGMCALAWLGGAGV